MEITNEFQECSDYLEKGYNVFLTGKAGSGKTTFLRYFLENNKSRKKCVLLAPTGLASINITTNTGFGASTIHKFFGFPPKPISKGNIKIINNDLIKKYSSVDIIIIDEISMVKSDIFSGMDWFLRINLNSSEPFAGKQVFIIGDLMQLPPVLGSGAEKQMIIHEHGGEYFFDTNTFKDLGFKFCYLTKNFRQKDENFISILNKIRNGNITQEDIHFINKNCFKSNLNYTEYTTICTTNDLAKHINNMELSKIDEEPIVLNAEIDGIFNSKSCPVDEEIKVKKGCKLMMRNNDPDGRWINGTVAKLVDFDETNRLMCVEINDTKYEVERLKYESVTYEYNKEKQSLEQQVTGTMIQYPVCLSYAMSFHKSQGMTFDKINIEFGRGSFAHGMTYVAFSRCKSLEGISLRSPLRLEDIIIDNRVTNFIKNNFNSSKLSIND
jgi:ATP-dependent DNA helicase PIF1